MTVACSFAGSMWTSITVSERLPPPICSSVPNAICSSGESPLRESLPKTR